MHKLEEGELEFDFTTALNSLKFDQKDPTLPNYHDLQNMARVDFIVEMQNDIYFIEVKDPSNPRAVNRAGFMQKIVNGTLVSSLKNKYLYTFFFRWAENRLKKSVHYLCLITLDSADILTINSQLKQIYLVKQLSTNSSRWSRVPLASCQVHNITTWSAVFPDWPITRTTP